MEKSTTKRQILLKGLGQAISARREKLGLSQRQLSQITGVDRSFLSYIENGKRNLSICLLADIAKGLNVSLEYLAKEGMKISRSEQSRA